MSITSQYLDEAVTLLSNEGYEIGDYNPHGVSAWLIQTGSIVAIGIGENELEAIDNVIDANLFDSIQLSNTQVRELMRDEMIEDYLCAGNASEYFDTLNGLLIDKIIQA